MKKTVSGGGVVVRDDKVVVVNQSNVSWSFPKGHVDEGETPLEAAKREIYEETGLKNLEFVKELGFIQRYLGGDDKSELKKIFMFLFRTNQEVLKSIDPDNPEARWVEKDKVVDLLSYEKDKEFFLSIIDEI
jgi:ADP-ribose pyrophosphatase YjhB (NUDIX family)